MAAFGDRARRTAALGKPAVARRLDRQLRRQPDHRRRRAHRGRDRYRLGPAGARPFGAAQPPQRPGAAAPAPSVALLPLATIYPLPLRDLVSNWWTWWQGDACGMLITTPLVLTWSVPGMKWTRGKVREAMLF